MPVRFPDARLIQWPERPLCYETTLADFLANGGDVRETDKRRYISPIPEAVPGGTIEFPFQVAGYILHAGPGWELLTALGSNKPVAIYRPDFSLGVAPEHRRRGLGVGLVVWRTEHRGQARTNQNYGRTPAVYQMTVRAHRMIVERALMRGDRVPPEVLQDYPDLRDGDRPDKSVG